MASEIRVDKITSLSGVGTITPSVTGVEIAGITTVTTLKATTGIVTTLTATTGIVTTFEATIGNITTLRAPTGIVTTLTANTTTHLDDVTFTGASANITFDKSADDLLFDDNAQAKFGTDGDLSIFHNGAHSFIQETGTGALQIRGANLILDNADGSKRYIDCNDGGSVELFHNNTRRFQTTGAGISVSQTSGGFSEFRHGGGSSGVRIAGPAESSGANLIFANNHNSTLDDLLIKVGGVSGTEKVRFLDTGGITFNGDTANANALDDYEEGDWTPKQVDGGTNYTTSHAKYVKIGKLVHLTFDITSSSATNLTQIWNLPFTPSNYSTWHLAYYAINGSTTNTGTSGYVAGRHGGLVVPSSGGYLHTRITGGTTQWNITNTDRLIGSASYETTT